MNNINSIDRDNPLWISEERIKNDVYSTFEKNRTKAKEKYDSNRNYVNDSNYESQTAFMSYRELDASKKSWRNIEGLIGKLYSKPYFSHISALLNGTEEEYFLSDNENLESIMLVGENGYLLPFKRDDKRPFLSKIFHCYQSRNGLPFEDLKGDIIEPTLICDDEINSGELLNVALLYSKYTPIQENIDADEVLVRKLQENRENPTLSNIISTLQYSQFSIIQDDVDADFAVQGCAGSGKSQVLLHRLFYLRDQLSDENWGKVLLITPTELFRSYSSELVRRYGLASIKNTSIEENEFKNYEAGDALETEEIEIPEIAEIDNEDNNKENAKKTEIEAICAQDEMDGIEEMLIDRQFYVATAYAKAEAAENPEKKGIYNQLKYAFDDPSAKCNYTAENLFSLMSSNDDLENALVVSAALRTFFSNQVKYDYDIKSVYNALNDYELLESIDSLRQILYDMSEFKATYNTGLDYYADYHKRDQKALDEEIKELQKEAEEFYNKNNKRLQNAAKKDGRQIFEKNIFPPLFDDAAQEAYIESTETYTKLFEDLGKYRSIMNALAQIMFDELR